MNKSVGRWDQTRWPGCLFRRLRGEPSARPACWRTPPRRPRCACPGRECPAGRAGRGQRRRPMRPGVARRLGLGTHGAHGVLLMVQTWDVAQDQVDTCRHMVEQERHTVVHCPTPKRVVVVEDQPSVRGRCRKLVHQHATEASSRQTPGSTARTSASHGTSSSRPAASWSPKTSRSRSNSKPS